MPRPRPPWGPLSVVLMLLCGRPREARACPSPCACYVPSELHCTFRSLPAVPAGISTHVERINLGFNSIQTLSETSFAGMSKLGLLMLHSNEISTIPDGALRDLSSLQVFKFSYNKLRVVTRRTLQGLSSLVRLHMDHNQLEFIHPHAFHGLLALRLLHLEGNLLHQLHPATFSTLSLLDHFRLSTIRHLYLAENALSTLPDGVLRRMPLLENLYLHANPWACDCRAHWFLRWEARAKGVLKCKKDKAYKGGQLCAMCSTPQKSERRELHELTDIACLKPSIDSPLRHNRSRAKDEEEEEEEEDQEDMDASPLLLDGSRSLRWAITLNMTDEHGNMVLLACDIRKPTDLARVHLNQSDPQEVDVNATVALDFECPMTRENYEKLWKLIAYYSEVPVTLRRGAMTSREPRISYRYRQDTDDDSLYYTGVRADIAAQPEWVLQPSINIQLNRGRSSARKVLLSYRTQYAQSVTSKDMEQTQSRSWVMIEPGEDLEGAKTILEGHPGQLSCQVRASESPSIFWVLPDGSVLKAPTEDDGDGRFSVLSSGWLRIKSTQLSDSGLYKCMAQVRDEMDHMVYRVVVLPPTTYPSSGSFPTIHKDIGEPVTVPCAVLAIPEAHLSWILPNGRIIDHHRANASHAYVSANGSLHIPKVQPGDSGYYTCSAVNQLGADHLTVEIEVNRKGIPKGLRRQGGRGLSRARGQLVEDEGSSGIGEEDMTLKRVLNPMDQEGFLKMKVQAAAGDKKAKKGRRKLKTWKHPEKEPTDTVAEGRRTFESRRRINVASKQINPERWADILARVRGKNLPKNTEINQDVGTATLPSTTQQAETPVSPIEAPPSVPLEQTETVTQESSADVSLSGEEEEMSTTVSPTSRQMDPDPRGETPISSQRLEEETEEAFAGWTKHGIPTVVDTKQVPATTLTYEPSETSSAVNARDNINAAITEGHTADESWSLATDIPVSEAGNGENKQPWDAASLGGVDMKTQFPPHAETVSKGEMMSIRSPTSSGWAAVSSTPASPQAHTPRDEDIIGRFYLQRQGKKTPKKKNHRDPTRRRPPENTREEGEPTTVPNPTSALTQSTKAATLWDTHISTPIPAPTSSALATHPSRRRPHGKRKFHPNRGRHGQKQPQETTWAPRETSNRVSETKTTSHMETSGTPPSWVERTTALVLQEHKKVTSKVTSRRKQGKKAHRHWTTSSPGSPMEGAAQAHPSTSTLRDPPTIPGKIEESGKGTQVTGHIRMSTELPLTHTTVQVATASTFQPVPHGKHEGRYEVQVSHEHGAPYTVTQARDFSTPRARPTEADVSVLSTSDASQAAVRDFTDGPLGDPGAPGWTSRHDVPQTTLVEGLTDTTLVEELQQVGSTSQVLPALEASTQSPREDGSVWNKPTSAQTGGSSTKRITTFSTIQETTMKPRPGSRPHNLVPSPAHEKNLPTSTPSPPMTLRPLLQSSKEPTASTSPTSATPTASRGLENVMENPDSQMPQVNEKDASHEWGVGELTTLPPTPRKFHLAPKQTLEEELFDSNSPDSLLRGSESPPHNRMNFSLPVSRDSTLPTHSKDTVTPPQNTAWSPPRPFPTSQPPPRHLTTKPEATVYPSEVWPENQSFATPRVLSSTSHATLLLPGPSMASEQSKDPFASRFSTGLGNNYIPESMKPVDELPRQRPPHFPDGRLPFFMNRMHTFPQLRVTERPQPPTSPPLLTRDRNHNPFRRTHAHSMLHVDFGPPAPPSVRSTPSPTHFANTPLAYTTRSSIPFLTSSVQASGNFHPSGSRLFAGGPPAAKFWTLGQKPQIITKLPHTVSVTADSDAVFHCEAVGKPEPLVTWTKVSTGALLTPNVRIQRFQVLKNGTLVIHKVQVQDRGQYVCTASNLHGADQMGVLLSVAVQQPHILASHYQDVTVYLGDTIVMECLAKGTPAPQISWIFPDRSVWQAVSTVQGRITLHQNRSLSIKDASFSDRGVYKCVASNAAGADSLAIRLHVAALPPVIQQDKAENISLPPGLSIHIHCSARAAPPASLRWVLGDGTHIGPSQFLRGNLFVFPNGTLYIRNLAARDSGRYECVAANAVGSARRSVRLSVQHPKATAQRLSVQHPKATARITAASPRSSLVRYGASLSLHCHATGDPAPRLLWRLPAGRLLDPLSSLDGRVKVFPNGTLVVSSVTDRDSGDYLCVARNKAGDDYVALKVDVVMEPAKIEHKDDQDHQVLYGGNLKVDCVATGLPSPEISWSLPDGSLVNPLMQSDDSGTGRSKRYVVFNNGTLYFNDVGPREEGDYTCFAENQVGKDEMTVHVKVVSQPTATRGTTLTMLHVQYGDVLTVPCQAEGDPVAKVTWLSPANRVIPISSDKYQVYPDGTLLIHKAQRSDSGNYTCLLRNSAGEARKTVWVQVNVQSPKINGSPHVISTLMDTVTVGSRKLIDCKAEGTPTPRVLWAFPEGVVLPAPYHGNRVVVHANGTLDIRSVRKSDPAHVECIARNEGGEAKLIVQLAIQDPVERPVFNDPVTEKITATAGHTISLNCSASGSPPPTLLWVLPNSTELHGGQHLQRFYHKHDGMLHISDLSASDAGPYRCVARNPAGHMERLVSLKVDLNPTPSSHYHNLVSIVNGETLHLPCTSPGSRLGRISWTLPNRMSLEGPQTRGRFSLWDNGTLTVHSISVFDRGTYMCRIDDESGSSVLTIPVIVIAYPPRITSEPTPVIYARPGSTVKISCVAMGVPKAQIKWELPDKAQLMAGAQARLYGNRYVHPQGSLTIQHISPRDAGFYKCSATNILGTDSKTTYIHVY